MERRDIIIQTVEDLVADFLYYDRKEDEELGRGEIEEAIKNNEITVDEIIDTFINNFQDKIKNQW